MKLADEFGIGMVSVDNATHYLWGGGYVIDAALKGYIAYTNCTSATSEVVPFGGKTPTMGTNPHSWGFPTQAAVGTSGPRNKAPCILEIRRQGR
jgi:LDH2 family malate/lactate/ureidoglycolate dehydrogenase